MKNISCTDTTKSAEKYRLAAQSIERGIDKFSCNALEKLGAYGEKIAFIAMYGPDAKGQDSQGNATWIPAAAFPWNPRSHRYSEELGRNSRIIALCLMAAMVEAGDA